MHNLIIKFRRKLLYYRLKYYIKRKKSKILKLDGSKYRGIGKTYTLLQLGKEFQIPVLYPNLIARDNAKKLYSELSPYKVIAPNRLENNRSYIPVILVDEYQLLDKKTREYLHRFTYIGVSTSCKK